MDKLTMMICPHDTAKNPDRWFRLIQYLNTHLNNVSVHFDIALDFQEFYSKMNKADLVYANPNHSQELMANGYLPLVRPINLYDEVVFIASSEVNNPTLEDFQGADIATVTNTLTSKLAIFTLQEKGIKPGQLLNQSSWLGVIKSVSTGTPFGFIYKDTYNELNESTKKIVQKIAETSVAQLFHQFNLSPSAINYQASLKNIFLEMNTDEKGKSVLQELNIEGWTIPTIEEIDMIQSLANI